MQDRQEEQPQQGWSTTESSYTQRYGAQLTKRKMARMTEKTRPAIFLYRASKEWKIKVTKGNKEVAVHKLAKFVTKGHIH